MDVEVGKECEEECSEEEEERHKHLWIVTLHEERETGMDGPGDELDQLHGGDVPGEDAVNILFLEMEIFYLFHQRYFWTLGPKEDMK